MLIISRKRESSFNIICPSGEIVKVIILGKTKRDNDQIKIGIEAPNNVKIIRDDIKKLIK